MYLTTEGLAVKILERKKRGKWIRWIKTIASPQNISIDTNRMDLISRPSIILDDVSRMVLAGGEFSGINTWTATGLVAESYL